MRTNIYLTIGVGLAMLTSLGPAALAGTATVTGVSADDPLFESPSTDLKTKYKAQLGPNPGQCNAQVEITASQTGAGAGSTCQDLDDAQAGSSGPVFYGATLVTFEPAPGCRVGAPSSSSTTVDDVAPAGDSIGPIVTQLPDFGTLTPTWVVWTFDADLYEITLEFTENCPSGATTESVTWLQRA